MSKNILSHILHFFFFKITDVQCYNSYRYIKYLYSLRVTKLPMRLRMIKPKVLKVIGSNCLSFIRKREGKILFSDHI